MMNSRSKAFLLLSKWLFTLMMIHSNWAMAQDVKIGGYHYPPFMYEQSNRGIYPDILAIIAQKTDLQVHWQYYPYPRLTALFNSGEIQIEMGSSPVWTQMAKVQGVYTQPFYTLKDVAVFKSGSTKDSKNIKGQRIGVVRGYSFPQFQEAFDSGIATRIDAPNELHLIRLLLNKRVDQIFINQDLFQFHRQNNVKMRLLQVGDVVGSYDIAIRIHPDYKHLLAPINQAINDMKESNRIQLIINQYLTQ